MLFANFFRPTFHDQLLENQLSPITVLGLFVGKLVGLLVGVNEGLLDGLLVGLSVGLHIKPMV